MTDLMEYWDDVDVDAIEASSGRPDPVPTADYLVVMSGHEVKATRSGTGAMLNGVFKIAEGQYEGQVVFNNYNIKNDSVQAQKIGISQFKGLCAACGVEFEEAKRDVTLLHHIPILAKVVYVGETEDKVEKGKFYPPKNEIKSVRSASSTPPKAKAPATASAARPAVAARPAAVATKPAGAAPPWKKKPAPVAQMEDDEIPF